jgi:hypothetical protein
MSTAAQVRAGHYRTQTHLSHVPSYCFMVYWPPLLPELDCDASDPVEGSSRVDFVYTPLEPKLLFGRRERAVVQTASVQTKHLGLSAQR